MLATARGPRRPASSLRPTAPPTKKAAAAVVASRAASPGELGAGRRGRPGRRSFRFRLPPPLFPEVTWCGCSRLGVSRPRRPPRPRRRACALRPAGVSGSLRRPGAGTRERCWAGHWKRLQSLTREVKGGTAAGFEGGGGRRPRRWELHGGAVTAPQGIRQRGKCPV